MTRVRTRRIGLLAMLFAVLALPAHAQMVQASVADCDASASSRVLVARKSQAAPARAYWLDRQWLQWPGAPKQGRYRLYASADAALVADVGARVSGADAGFDLVETKSPIPDAVTAKFRWIGDGVALRVPAGVQVQLPSLLRGQLLLVREDVSGRVIDSTALQVPGMLDDLYARATQLPDLGVRVDVHGSSYRLWAPTARMVALCVFFDGKPQLQPMQRDAATGTWSVRSDARSGYYQYLVDVYVPGIGIVRNRVTDPYSISLDADSRRSWIGDRDAAALKPDGWDAESRPPALASQTDMVVYEVHVRDFSRDDASVPAAHRGRYLAFTDTDSNGMRELHALAQAGVTDVHLLPVFDIASVPETGCVSPRVPDVAPGSEAQQATVMVDAARDCFNWGYDPWHYSAPEGSYASDANAGSVRIREFRAMVQALHAIGLRVGMDVVYNHTSQGGQDAHSVLDRIVPGYYQRLDADGAIEHSTCCANTATEHAMMGKLMIDSVTQWAREYHLDSFRFDLMGHQPRAVMKSLQHAVDAAAGRHVNLIGEGWNFGEVTDGKRFVQASQLSLGGSGIGTFSDRARDAIRGGSASDHGEAMLARQGYVNGLFYAPNAHAHAVRTDLLQAADMVRVGLAGTLRDYRLHAFDGHEKTLAQIGYGGQPAGYATQPSEVVNYVENHDNQTLFDIDALKLPRATSRTDRARVQLLATALVAFSQGVAYYHAGIELLRSKSLDRNSFDSGDWFNRIDWSGRDNHFGSGLPPKPDNGQDWPLLRPLLADVRIKPSADDIAFMRAGFRDLLRIRRSSTLFRLRSDADVRARLTFPNSGAGQNPVVMVGHLDGRGYPGADFDEVLYLANVSAQAQDLVLPAQAGKAYVLHPVQASVDAADPRPRTQARYDAASGRFRVPPRTAVVYVVPQE